MILAPAAAERNTRTAAEEWRESGGRIQEAGFRIQEPGVQEFGSGVTESKQSLQRLLEAAKASARASSALLSEFFSDAVNLNS